MSRPTFICRLPPLRSLAQWIVLLGLGARGLTGSVGGQTLNLPARPAHAPTGTQFTNIITPLTLTQREQWVYAQVISGNVPDFLRALQPVMVSAGGHSATYHVTPDYLAIGSDDDHFLTPCTPIVAQRLANRLGWSLPTRKMVNQIWTNAAVKLNPQPIEPSAEMTTVPVFAWHNIMVRTQRNAFTNNSPLGALVSGNKKDVILSNELTNRPPPPRVIIYGWHYPSGVSIQPLSGVHEETYADYSHGIRFAQNAMLVNGASNTVSNVLQSPGLAVLLSDETSQPSFTIPLPHYTVAPLAPVVMTHPRSQSRLLTEDAAFEALVIGDEPLRYQWRFNNMAIPGATNASLPLPKLQAAPAGHYTVFVTNTTGSATSRIAVLRVGTNTFPRLFTENFTGNPATNWSVFWGAANGVPDYTVDWSFDYGVTPYTFNGVTALIPPAPNTPAGTATRAVKLTVNNNDTIGATAAVNLYPKGANFSGAFTLKFDLWLNYPGNAGGTGSTGSTEHALFGINHLGTNVNWATAAASASDGLWFAVTGEGGDSRDYRSYVGDLVGAPIDLTGSSTSGLVGTNHNQAVFQKLFPATRFETPGAPGKNWVEVELRQTNNVIVWLLDGNLIALRTNTSAFTSGTLMLGYMDTFASIASPARDAFALFANVRVENLAPPPMVFVSTSRLPGGDRALTLASAPHDTFWLETSTNLASWQTLALLTTEATGHAAYVDTNAPAFATWFYRARR